MKNPAVGIILGHMKPHTAPSEDPLEQAMDDLISAVHDEDPKAAAVAFKAAFEELEKEEEPEPGAGGE